MISIHRLVIWVDFESKWVIFNKIKKILLCVPKHPKKKGWKGFPILRLNDLSNRAFRHVVQSSFIFASSNCDWLKQISCFISINSSCFLQEQMNIQLHVEMLFSVIVLVRDIECARSLIPNCLLVRIALLYRSLMQRAVLVAATCCALNYTEFIAIFRLFWIGSYYNFPIDLEQNSISETELIIIFRSIGHWMWYLFVGENFCWGLFRLVLLKAFVSKFDIIDNEICCECFHILRITQKL